MERERRFRRLYGQHQPDVLASFLRRLDREDAVEAKAEDCEVLAALDRLGPLDREVLSLRLWEEATFGEIAQVVGCSPHAAEQRYAKALRRFRSAWGRTGHISVGGTHRSQHEQEHSREA